MSARVVAALLVAIGVSLVGVALVAGRPGSSAATLPVGWMIAGAPVADAPHAGGDTPGPTDAGERGSPSASQSVTPTAEPSQAPADVPLPEAALLARLADDGWEVVILGEDGISVTLEAATDDPGVRVDLCRAASTAVYELVGRDAVIMVVVEGPSRENEVRGIVGVPTSCRAED